MWILELSHASISPSHVAVAQADIRHTSDIPQYAAMTVKRLLSVPSAGLKLHGTSRAECAITRGSIGRASCRPPWDVEGRHPWAARSQTSPRDAEKRRLPDPARARARRNVRPSAVQPPSSYQQGAGAGCGAERRRISFAVLCMLGGGQLVSSLLTDFLDLPLAIADNQTYAWTMGAVPGSTRLAQVLHLLESLVWTVSSCRTGSVCQADNWKPGLATSGSIALLAMDS